MYSISIWAHGQHRQLSLTTTAVTLWANEQSSIHGADAAWMQAGCLQARWKTASEGAARNEGEESEQVELWDGGSVSPRTMLLDIPCVVQLHQYWLEVSCPLKSEQVNPEFLRPQRRIGARGDRSSATEPRPPSAATLRQWFESLAAIQRQPNTSQDLFRSVAQAMVAPGGLDACIVLRRSPRTSDDPARDYSWGIVASHIAPPIGLSFEPAIADRSAQERTGIIVPSLLGREGVSIISVPFFDDRDEVAGMVYGTRAATAKNSRRGFRPFEVQWAQVLAETVTAGHVRFEIEQREARARYVFGRSFSPPVIKALEQNPDILTPRECTVTVLCADLRNFTRIGAKLESMVACELLSDVMDQLTAKVMETEGVVLDYYGDGLAAMWNAPVTQSDHGRRAGETALGMQHCMKEINRRWEARVGSPLALAIGIATGPAQVGNAGSTQRMKYGPRGTTVNLASRLESAAKRLEVPILVCNQTNQHLIPAWTTYRVARVSLSGIDEPVDVYELLAIDRDTSLSTILDQYEEALACLEQGEVDAAITKFENLNQHSDRLGPIGVLRSKATHASKTGESLSVIDISRLPARADA